ncbi:methyl-accepting chemotaxis protein [Agrobacterium vitis]|uniref:HAMP domain-containing protein n=1 Tax=Agrobacterium vitis TaxID=373 RepID=A0A6S6MPZ1_AGRVI|nr:methyl-accepting chemotaxis protein [Agrobacterium vitis]MCF1453586.1 HAMP domain-containing protein [Agrobacterium vitis]MVA55523.1 HAMP domain-containing protein [Agrobacterium vitis]BCH54603.1 methyl-accepting chemotaxis protein [Agrobacterium vitis]
MKNLSIIGKFLSIMALFGLFTVGIAAYSGAKLKSIDAAYSGLLEQESAASLYLARANRSMQSARASLADIMLSRSDALNQSAAKEFETARGSFVTFMDTAAKALPANADITALKADTLKILDQTCGNAMQAGKTATNDDDVVRSQSIFLRECQPEFAKIAPRFTEVVTNISKAADAESNDLSNMTNSTVITTVVGVLVGLVLVLTIGFFAIRAWLVVPIRDLAAKMGILSGGDLSAMVEGTDRRDEVGIMARAVQIFKDNGLAARELEKQAAAVRDMSEVERQRVAEADAKRAAEMAQATSGLAEGLKRLSAGDLTFQLTQNFATEFEGLRTDFNSTVEQLRDTMSSVAIATGSIDSGSREVSQSANDLSKRTEQQAASLEETAAALDQITTNVSNSSKRAEEARAMAVQANQSARQSGEVVSNAVNAMQRIEQSSSQISNIIGVIDEIAFQTNLLALNAGVEAARAGEAGKGFAVVAQEVRELAQRSAQAAKEIKDLIRNSASEVENGVKLVTATGDVLKIIEGHVVAINGQLDAIAISAREQSVGLSEVNIAVNQMDQVTQQNAAMVEEATAASSSLANEAEKLRHLVGQFQIGSGSSGLVANAAPSGGRSAGPVPASAGQRPVASPARRMVGQVAKALGMNTAAKQESWEEF